MPLCREAEKADTRTRPIVFAISNIASSETATEPDVSVVDLRYGQRTGRVEAIELEFKSYCSDQ